MPDLILSPDELQALTGRSSKRLTPRCACGKPATIQCDGPSKRKSGTCDKHLCAGCASETRPDRHLCQACAAGAAVEPELF